MAQVSAWALDPDLAFLNHGSFGAVPRGVMGHRQALLDRMEADPIRFLAFEFHELLDAARVRAAGFVGADPDGFAFVPNATTGVNTLLRSAPLRAGDEILLTDHGYEACNLAAEQVAANRGASVRFARIPVPVTDGAQVRAAILDAVRPTTTWAVVDHVTSPTALVWPIAEIVGDLAGHGVRTIVDGAHGPGQVPVRIDDLGAAAYTGNWHKWTCAPKGSGFLWVEPGWRDSVRPLVVSHGAGERGDDRSRFRAMFDWTGTVDPTPYLTVPAALDAVGSMRPGGWDEVMRSNRDTLLGLRARIVDEVGLEPVGPTDLVGSMASFLVPQSWWASLDPPEAAATLQRRLSEAHGVVVGVATRRGADEVLVRVSAHLHTDPGWGDRLVEALGTIGNNSG